MLEWIAEGASARFFGSGIMCGRYTLRRIDLARAALGAGMPELPFDEFSERARYNVAPSQSVPLVRMDGEGRRVLAIARWGLVPGWAKSLPKFQPINARAETLSGSNLFRSAFERRRCLIPADGFYEWKAPPDKGPKRPCFFHFKDHQPFAFAGLWERWQSKEGGALESCTIITTTPNEVVQPIHDRMPVIVRPEDYGRWLDCGGSSCASVQDVLAPYPADDMEVHFVSTRVNRPANDGPELIEPE